MINILIDSNIYISLKYNVYTGPLKGLLKYMEKGIVQLYTNEIINKEVMKHVKKELEAEKKKIQKTIDENKMITCALRKSDYSLKEEIEKMCDDFFQSIQLFLSKALLIENNSVNLEDVLQQYFDTLPPFEDNKEKKSEFPDAVIIESIKHRKDVNNFLYVVTNDRGWKAAFPKDNKHKVIIIDNIYEMMEEIFLKMYDDENIIDKIQNELYAEIEMRTEEYIERYDFSKVVENNDEIFCLEFDETRSLIVKEIKLSFEDINFMCPTEINASFRFDSFCSIEFEYSYIDHSSEIYDREDGEVYFTKRGIGTSFIEFELPMEILVTMNENNYDNQETILKIEKIEFNEINNDDFKIKTLYQDCIDDDYFDDEMLINPNTCPDCGEVITEENDGLNGFCRKCGSNH